MTPDRAEWIAAGELYARRGWSILPLKADKSAAGRWKLCQSERVAPQDVAGWFRRQKVLGGVGIVLGAVSGHLWVRDFDNANAYHRWAKSQPVEAARHPTVRTARGFHVYGRWPGVATQNFADGELRGEGVYVAAPPTVHPSGAVYTWEVPLPDGAIPEADPYLLGLCEGHSPPCNRENRANREGESTERTERTEETEANRETEAIRGGWLGCESCGAEIEAAIVRTLPKMFASRNAFLFRLARALKAIPALAALPLDRIRELRPIVQEWYRRALPHMLTKDFGETWGDFAHAWGRVRHPEGADVLGEALKAAKVAPAPVWACDYSEGQQLLAGLCRELQRSAGDADFFLGVAKAAQCVGDVDKGTAWRWLRAFEADGAIRATTKGSQRTGRATRYRYVADDL